MTDKDILLSDLNDISEILNNNGYGGWCATIRKAVAQLKEQEAVVRCKNCKHRPTYPEAYGAEIDGKWCYWCELHRSWKHDDWFCADGERKSI